MIMRDLLVASMGLISVNDLGGNRYLLRCKHYRGFAQYTNVRFWPNSARCLVGELSDRFLGESLDRISTQTS